MGSCIASSSSSSINAHDAPVYEFTGSQMGAKEHLEECTGGVIQDEAQQISPDEGAVESGDVTPSSGSDSSKQLKIVVKHNRFLFPTYMLLIVDIVNEIINDKSMFVGMFLPVAKAIQSDSAVPIDVDHFYSLCCSREPVTLDFVSRSQHTIVGMA